MIKCKWISNQFPLIQFMRFSQQVYWGGLPFSPLEDHILSELSTMTCLSWVAPRGTAYSFIELCKPLCHDKAVIHEGETVRDGVLACCNPWGHTEWDTMGSRTATSNLHLTCLSCFFFLLKTFYSLCENSLILTNSLENAPSLLLQTSSSAPSRALLSCWA